MIVANGSTDTTTYWVLRDSATHLPKTGITITGISVYYVEQGAAISGPTSLTALAAADSAHADNKGYEIGQGLYRIDWPDAAFDGGVGKHVILVVVCSGVDTAYLDVELSPTVNAADIADAILARDLGSGSGAGTLNERTVRSALRMLRNKWSISGSTLTVTKENDTDSAWTSTLSTNAAADPITGSDPT